MNTPQLEHVTPSALVITLLLTSCLQWIVPSPAAAQTVDQLTPHRV
jgi:hypothetical protein